MTQKFRWNLRSFVVRRVTVVTADEFLPWMGWGGTPRKIGGVQPASQTPYPIYDQILRYSLPYLWPEPYIKILFQTCILIKSLVQTNVKLP